MDSKRKQKKTKKSSNQGGIPSARNHKEWYLHYPELVKGAIGPNFNRFRGLYEQAVKGGSDRSIPSCAGIALDLLPCISDADTLRNSIVRLYSAVRKANSGSTNGMTPKDYLEYVMNFRAVVAVLALAKWAYGTLTKYHNLDSTLPYSLFAAKGLDYRTFADNASNLRNKINMLSEQLKVFSSLNLDLFKRTEWLLQNTFKDSNDAKSQLFTFTIKDLYMLSTSGQPAPNTIAGYISGTGTGATYTNFMNDVDSVIDVFINRDSTPIIAGDMAKAFGVDKLYKFPYIEENFKVEAAYEESVLTQIQNATLLYFSDEISGTFSITYNTAGIITDVLYEVGLGTGSINEILPAKDYDSLYVNSYKDNIDNGDVLSYTRLMAHGEFDSGNSTFTYDSFGTEIAKYITVIYKDSSSSNPYKLASMEIYNGKVLATTNLDGASLQITAWSVFDWMPRVFFNFGFYISGQTTLTYYSFHPLWDFNDYALVTIENLSIYHSFAFMSMLYTPIPVRVATHLEVIK